MIVFSQFKETLHRMADMLACSKLGSVMVHGGLDMQEREQVGAELLLRLYCQKPTVI